MRDQPGGIAGSDCGIPASLSLGAQMRMVAAIVGAAESQVSVFGIGSFGQIWFQDYCVCHRSENGAVTSQIFLSSSTLLSSAVYAPDDGAPFRHDRAGI